MKYKLHIGDKIRAAVELDYIRYFNETTTIVITKEHNEYEEIEVTKSLDEDNVTIIDTKKKKSSK